MRAFYRIIAKKTRQSVLRNITLVFLQETMSVHIFLARNTSANRWCVFCFWFVPKKSTHQFTHHFGKNQRFFLLGNIFASQSYFFC